MAFFGLLAWRVAGPGISAEYCCQIRPEDAILVLDALLEEKELNLFDRSTSDKIKAPLIKYQQFFQDFKVFGLEFNDNRASGSYAELKNAVDAQLKDLRERLNVRRRVLQKLTRIDNDVRRVHSVSALSVQPGGSLGWIKQSEQDLARTTRLGEEVVAAFCKRMEVTYPECYKSLWCDVSLLPGDYCGLSRHLVGQLFGDGFWTPLEVSDSTNVIPIKLQSLEMLLDELIHQSA